MECRSLKTESLEEIHRCFNEAFSDYLVRIHLPFEKFQKTMIRNGVDLKFSIGLYDKSQLVGFILNAVGTWNNRRTVYDSGTGIIKQYRGKKYSKKMFDVLKQTLIEHGFSQYLLEVIQSNTPAYTLYRNQGFEIVRALACFTAAKKDVRKEIGCSCECAEMSFVDWGLLTTFWNVEPSWQNSLQAVERVFNDFAKVGAFVNDDCVGYSVFYPPSGEIVHIAVRKDVRRRGIGSMLLDKISVETKSSHLRVINVDKRDRETIDFLEKNGFINDINQYEMVLDLTR